MTKNATDTSRQTLPRITVVTMEPAHGRDWTWYADLRIVTISPRLDGSGHTRALAELRDKLAS